MNPTIYDVSKLAGVSTATISCLLPSVTAAKTEKEKIIRQKIKTNAFFSFFLILLLPFHDKTEITIITVFSSAIPRFERHMVVKAVGFYKQETFKTKVINYFVIKYKVR